MADSNLGAHHVDQIIQIRAMHNVRQHRSIHLFVFDPISAVQVRHVEIVTLIAPTLVEDLFEFFFRIEIHAQSEIQTPLARLRRSSIRIDDEQRRSGRPPCESGWTTTTSTARGRAIDQLAAISTDVIIRNAVDEGVRAAIAQTITNQLAATATTARTTAALAACGRLHIENHSFSAGMQQGILSLGNSGHRYDSLWQSVEVDLYGNGLSWAAWCLRLLLARSCIGSARGDVSSASSRW